MINSKSIGDRAEAKIFSACVERGWTVSLPFGDNARYDMVVDAPNRGLMRVQVKSASCNTRNDRGITASLTSNSLGAKDHGKHHPYSVDEVDVFALYFPGCKEWQEDERILFLERDKPLIVKKGLFQQTVNLVLPSWTGKQKKGIHHAKEFTLAAWHLALEELSPLNKKAKGWRNVQDKAA